VDSLNGDASIDLNGSCSLTAAGAFHNVTVSAKGSCNVRLTGNVAGNYTAKAYGACDVRLAGAVAGKIETSTAGASSIHFDR
jgi:hypothetical protein